MPFRAVGALVGMSKDTAHRAVTEVVPLLAGGALPLFNGGCGRPSSGTANILSAQLVSPTEVAVSVDTCGATRAYSVEAAPEVMKVRVTYSDYQEGDDCADGIIVALPMELGERTLVDANGNDEFMIVPGPLRS